MCRFTLYLGPKIRLGTLVTDPKNSLIHQSYDSHERRHKLNGDGFGVAWYPGAVSDEPALFKSISPAWNNANLIELARVVESGCILAHVRAATQQLAISEANCHPFKSGPFAFMHNGDVGGFARVRRALLGALTDQSFQMIRGNTDSEHVFALFLDDVRQATAKEAGARLAEAMRRTIERVVALAGTHAPGAHCYLNLAATDGRAAVATRFTTKPAYDGESLFVHHGRRYVCEGDVCRMIEPDAQGGAVLVCSERLSDDAGWDVVPRNTMVVVGEDRSVRLEKLG